MKIRNYYLVNKETNEIHYILKVDYSVRSQDESPESWLSGNLYMADKDRRMSLDDLRSVDYSDEYDFIGDPEITEAFILVSNINYVTYKGYRLYSFPSNLQLWEDFAGNDIVEANAFLAECFKRFVGNDEVSKWSQIFENSFEDKYGVNKIIMSYFTIEQDEDANVQNHPDLR